MCPFSKLKKGHQRRGDGRKENHNRNYQHKDGRRTTEPDGGRTADGYGEVYVLKQVCILNYSPTDGNPSAGLHANNCKQVLFSTEKNKTHTILIHFSLPFWPFVFRNDSASRFAQKNKFCTRCRNIQLQLCTSKFILYFYISIQRRF